MKTVFFLRISLFTTVLLFVLYSCKKDESYHQVTAIEKQIHENINNYRKGEGLNPLVFQPILFREARAHSLRILNGVIQPGYEGLDDVFDDLRSKLGGEDAGAIVQLTGFTNANDIVELFKESASMDSVLLGTFTQSGVGYVTDKSSVNYITVLFLDIP